MVSVGLLPVLVVSLLLFTIGVVGVLVRRNLLVVFMSLELMLNAVALAFVGFARARADMDGQVAALFVMAVAAAEVAVGLSLVILLFRTRHTTQLDDLTMLKG
ncbi:MAG: NADH-quinone oxidoreductase subunit NuoK [Deltaproteobacteria bacterium]|nr:NADH-quinone oxidoreductase subunit NuoK [Deltaproteobacteria bacterium]